MRTNNQPAVGRLLLGTLFSSLGVAAIVAGTSTVDAGPALGLALLVGGAVTLGAVLYGRLRSDSSETSRPEPTIVPTANDMTTEHEPDLLEQAALLDDSY